jgi:hypothetical protein
MMANTILKKQFSNPRYILMMVMRFLLWSCIAVAATEAFVPVVNRPQHHHYDAAARVASSVLMAASSFQSPPSNNHHAAAGGFARFFGVVAAASVLSLNIVDPASAANNMLENNDRIMCEYSNHDVASLSSTWASEKMKIPI